MNIADSHESYMRRALDLARRGTGSTRPNPLVGAVIVHGDRIVGEGFHQRAGEPHAEVMALRQAGESARGATMFVTLEPCNHHGRTPPCTKAILESGIERLYFASHDPNPHVEGGGADFLRTRGVECIEGPLSDEATYLNRGFFHWARTGRPWVIAKFAASLDGKIATQTGESQWITGPEARRRGHELRREVDAILVGVGTVVADDPRLTVRVEEPAPNERVERHGQGHRVLSSEGSKSLSREASQTQEAGMSFHERRGIEDQDSNLERGITRIVLDGRGRSPLESMIFAPVGGAVTLVATTDSSPDGWRDALRKRDVEVVVLNADGRGRIDLVNLLDELGGREIQSVLIEGGPTVHGSFFDAGIVDEVWAFIAPIVIGGTDAPGAVAGMGIAELSDALRLDSMHVEQHGKDVLVRGTTLDPRLRGDDIRDQTKAQSSILISH